MNPFHSRVPHPRLLFLLLGGLSAFAPLSIDMYLPSIPQIARAFSVPHSEIELSLASFFIGMSLGQLLYGTTIDRFGRKRPLYLGLVVYCLSSLVCATAANASVLIAARFLQALGACAGLVVSRATVRDMFDYRESAQVLSMLMLVSGTAPIVAPVIGGYIARFLGWQAVFYVLTGIGVLCLLAVAARLPETRAPNPAVRLRSTLGIYWRILRERHFSGFMLAGGIAHAGLFGYITGSPFVFMHVYAVPVDRFGWIFSLNALGYIASSQFNRRLLRRFSPDRIMHAGQLLLAVSGFALILCAAIDLGFWGILIPLFCYIASLGISTPNAIAAALSKHGSHAGAASALVGTIQFMLGATTSALVSHLNNGTPMTMAAVVGGCGIIGFCLFKLLVDRP